MLALPGDLSVVMSESMIIQVFPRNFLIESRNLF